MAECSVKKLFEPASVAIIGASENPGKIGYNVLRNLVESGYKGKIYPINPKGGSAFGINMYKSIEEVPGEVDLVTITIPAKLVLGAVKQCAQKKVKFLSIITSGFSEVGNTAEEKEMVEIARASGMRILGPNIFGIYSANASMNATFASGVIDPGGVAILTQSGALGIAMIGKTKVENIGLSAMVSIGNKCDIDESDLLEYLIDDPKTKAIMMYMEGVKGGQKLIKTLKKVTKVKPVVVIKSGRSKRGAAAAASHTGSLAGADNIFDAVMKQCNVHRAYSIGEALDWCKFLAEAPQVKGENAVIITNGGGIGVLAADACEQYGIKLDVDLAKLKDAFATVTPSFGSLKNPIDITGGAGMADYEKCIRTAFERKDIHSIIILGCETAVLDGNAMQGA
ncbi:MAG: CoA-binding protein, partial [Bacteriovoracaceae bacterium]|nr:CoA-binding protein [Bacteriovoracaceae bacterium]